MKTIRIILVVFAFSIALQLQSCASPEEKTLKMAEKAISDFLYNPQSYQRNNYTFDSLFSIDGSIDVYLGLYEVAELIDEIEPLIAQQGMYTTEMDIYSDDILNYGRLNYDSSKKKAESYSKRIQKLKNKIDSRMKAGLELYNDTTPNKKLAGYYLTLSYKATSISNKEMPGFFICIADTVPDKLIFTKSFDILEILKLTQDQHPIIKTSKYLEDTDIESYDIDDFIDYVTN